MASAPPPPPPPGLNGRPPIPPRRGGRGNLVFWLGAGVVGAGTSPSSVPLLSHVSLYIIVLLADAFWISVQLSEYA